MNNMLARFSQAELLVGGGALLIILADLIFGLVTRDFTVGQLPWAIATVVVFAIVALRMMGRTLPMDHQTILVMAGVAMAFVGVRDLLYDLRSIAGETATYLLGALVYYAGAALMAAGAFMSWWRRTA